MPVTIIAEAGVNHNGSLEMAKEMARAAKECGADIVKYQTAVPELVVSKFAEKAEYQKQTTDAAESQLEMIRKLHFSFEAHKELKEYCDSIGIQYLSAPFDIPSVRFLGTLGLPLIKMPSGEITNLPYLEEMAKLHTPVLLSTGMSTLDEITDALGVLDDGGCPEVTVLHCNTQYPTPYEDANLTAMLELYEQFGLPVGLSDHTPGWECDVAAAVLGAQVIEKHFTLDKSLPGPDQKASLDPAEFKAMVNAVRHVEAALGDGHKHLTASEAPNKAIARKSIVAARAEYGLLRPVVQKVAASDELDLQLVVTGAHLCPRLGETVHEIENDGFPIAARLPIFTDDADEPVACTITRTINVFDSYFAAHRPDAVLLLGDRFEIFAVATTAAARHIPIAHISGGDVTLGAADEYYRHCISKMAAVHFPSCADSAARLVRMGEAPDTVFCVGGLGDENIRTLPKMSREELCKSTGFDLMQPFALVTYHPETAPDAGSPAVQVQALCSAMDNVDSVFWLITGSNADAGGQVCTEMMQAFAASHPGRAGFVQSLGLRRYLSAMDCAALVAGNSSSGVVETPTFKVPTVNIGKRQAGRMVCANVLCCAPDAAAIEATMRKALSPSFAPVAASAVSPYGGGDTSGKICAVLQHFDFTKSKVFYDGPVPEFDPQRSVLV